MTAHRSSQAALRAARVLITLQTAIFAFLWAIPISLLLAYVSTEGLGDEETRPYLLLPLIVAVPALAAFTAGVVSVVTLRRHTHAAWATAVIYEVSLVSMSAWAIKVFPLTPLVFPLCVTTLFGLFALALLCFSRPQLTAAKETQSR